jgi:CRP/FNR family transcriptional regulator, anaerobic regulatory protein
LTSAEKIKQAFDYFFEAPIEAWESFASLGEVIKVDKSTVLKSNSTIEKYLYFVLKGTGGIFLWNKNNFVCIDLCFENDFFGDYMSFITNSPSALEVLSFEEMELFRISKANFDKIGNGTSYGDKICRFAAEGLFIHKQQQQIDILTKTAKERYLDLLVRNSTVVQRIPQKHIASYLGITAQSLSRIRSEICKP